MRRGGARGRLARTRATRDAGGVRRDECPDGEWLWAGPLADAPDARGRVGLDAGFAGNAPGAVWKVAYRDERERAAAARLASTHRSRQAAERSIQSAADVDGRACPIERGRQRVR